MKYIYWAISIFLALLLQGNISILSVSPNLTILLSYYAGIRYGETKGMLTGVFIGTLEDIISSSILGPNMLGKGLIGLFSSSFISSGFLRWTPFLGIAAVALLTMTDNSIVFLSIGIFDKLPADPLAAFFVTFMQSLLNTPAGIFIRPEYAD